MKKITAILALIMLIWGCAHPHSRIQIQEKLYQYDDVDDFVVWLETQPGIRKVEVNKRLFLTSSPPKVIVTYFQNFHKKKLLIAVVPDKKLKLVKPK